MLLSGMPTLVDTSDILYDQDCSGTEYAVWIIGRKIVAKGNANRNH